MLLSSGKSRGFLTSLVRFGFTGSDVVDGAEDCNCSGICGKPVVTPEIGLLPGSEALCGTYAKVQRPLQRQRAVLTRCGLHGWSDLITGSFELKRNHFESRR